MLGSYASSQSSIHPNQKTGTETPSSEPMLVAVSSGRRWLIAAKMPAGTPTTIATNMAANPSSTVAGK